MQTPNPKSLISVSCIFRFLFYLLKLMLLDANYRAYALDKKRLCVGNGLENFSYTFLNVFKVITYVLHLTRSAYLFSCRLIGPTIMTQIGLISCSLHTYRQWLKSSMPHCSISVKYFIMRYRCRILSTVLSLYMIVIGRLKTSLSFS